MITASSRNAIRQSRKVVMKPPISGPTAAAIAAEAPTSAYTRFCAAPEKFPWINDCIEGSRSDAPMPPKIAQKTMIARTSWASVIAIAPTAVPQETQLVRELAADQIADLAADQDERGRDERLQRDRRLDVAHRRLEVPHDRRDRHVHDRGVDDEHEHRHREEDREPAIHRRVLDGRRRCALGHPHLRDGGSRRLRRDEARRLRSIARRTGWLGSRWRSPGQSSQRTTIRPSRPGSGRAAASASTASELAVGQTSPGLDGHRLVRAAPGPDELAATRSAPGQTRDVPQRAATIRVRRRSSRSSPRKRKYASPLGSSRAARPCPEGNGTSTRRGEDRRVADRRANR